MEQLNLDPQRIQPPHEPDDLNHLQVIIARMAKDGWRGRPLLIEAVTDYPILGALYFAWTGSHRIEAARRLNLESVPCLMIPETDAKSEFTKAGYNRIGYSCWREALTGQEGPNDIDRFRGLQRTSLRDAIALYELEIESNANESRSR